MILKFEGKIIGQLETLPDGGVFFEKHVDPAKHKLKVFNGYAIQKDAFDAHIRGHRGTICIRETSGKSYYSEVYQWEGAETVNYGYGDQLVLPITSMKLLHQ